VTARASVVVPTYNRAESLERLMRQLAAQTVAGDIEVVVVDDGSRQDPTPRLRALEVPFELVIERQPNAGAASARHRGALRATAPVIIFLDDDMQVPASLVAAHLDVHARDGRAVVVGVIRPDCTGDDVLFERFRSEEMLRFAEDVREGRASFRGWNVCTGNLSMRRDAYLRVGGFDASLERSEDAELGARLEKDGARFYVSEEATSVHASDRDSVEGFRRRAKAYGLFDARVAKKHRDLPRASPRPFHELPRGASPLLALTLASPRAGERVAGVALRAARRMNQMGLERAALEFTSLAFGLDYARGVREDAGAAAAAFASFVDSADFAALHGALPRTFVAARRAAAAIADDLAMLRHYDEKYRSPDDRALTRVGPQILVAVRVMHFFRDAGAPLGARITSRLVRHVYGSDIHWDARIEPGVTIVHGMGLAISSKASIGRGCILFQNVTLGESVGGSPSLGRDVHVGPGATLLGPITVGDGSKVMAGCVVREDVPPASLVSAPAPTVGPRRGRA